MVRWWILGTLVAVAGWRVGGYYQKLTRYEGGQEVRIKTQIRSFPKVSFGRQEVEVEGIHIHMPAGVNVDYGDEIRVVGRLREKVIKKTRRPFSLDYQSIYIVDRDNKVLRYMGKIRKRVLANYRQWLPKTEAGLVEGIVLGGSTGMGNATRQDFRQVGLAHVVAASGYNLVILIGGLESLVWLVGRRHLIYMIIFCTLVYVLLTGVTAAVVRAAIMTGGLYIGRSMGRKNDGRWWLVLAGIIMIGFDPAVIEDIGWQLSFAATAGLVWVRTRGILSTGVVASLATAPIVWWNFGQVNWLGPLANWLVSWAVEILTQVGMLAAVAGLVWEPAGRVIAWVAWPVAWWMLNIVGWLAHAPGWVGGVGYGAVGGG